MPLLQLDSRVMIRLALLASNVAAADAIEQMTQDSSVFKLVHRSSPVSASQPVLQALSAVDPEVILMEVNGGEDAVELVKRLALASRGALVGFRSGWTSEEQSSFAKAGACELLREPFSASDLEEAAHRAVHLRRPITHQNVLAFLPSKAGSGCSTVAVNTAAALANDLNQRTLLIEADRRSGALSVLLDVEDRGGLAQVLSHAGALTGLEWRQHVVSIGKLDLLLANPFNLGTPPTWADYYQMLSFIEKQYDFIVVDLPEVVKQGDRGAIECSALGIYRLRTRRNFVEAGAIEENRVGMLCGAPGEHLRFGQPMGIAPAEPRYYSDDRSADVRGPAQRLPASTERCPRIALGFAR